MSALDDLIAAVEAENDPPWGADIPWSSFARGLGSGTPPNADNACLAYRGSLDAAKALHEALLPGWVYNVTPTFCLVYPIAAPEDEGIISGKADNPARAWLLVILRAYRSLQE